jgi:hypothetical protein
MILPERYAQRRNSWIRQVVINISLSVVGALKKNGPRVRDIIATYLEGEGTESGLR